LINGKLFDENVSRLFALCAKIFPDRYKKQDVFQKPTPSHLEMVRGSAF
jgi:hypothetical protein